MNTCQNGHFSIILCVFLHSCNVKEYSRAVRRGFCVCVYALVPALRKPDPIEFSLASSNLSICLLFSYSHILTFVKVFFRRAASVFTLMSRRFICSHLTSCSRFVLTESLPKSSLPNIFLSFLFDDNFFSMKMSFLSFKKSFRSLSSRCRQ